jgi:uncharacterized protein (DUF1501 family)
VILAGGNDSYNTVLSTDPASWDAYTQTRNQAPESIALPPPGTPANSALAASNIARLGGVLPIVPVNAVSGKTLALHPALKGLKTRFDQQRLAVVANVGSLVEPITKSQFEGQTQRVPTQLFSHNDQRSWWLSMATEGALDGWGGRLTADYRNRQPNPWLSSVAIDGNNVFPATAIYPAYQAGTLDVPNLRQDAFGCRGLGEAIVNVASNTNTANLFARDLAAVNQRADTASQLLLSSLPQPNSMPYGTATNSGAYSQANDPHLKFVNPFSLRSEFNPLAAQLQMAARLIKTARSLGLTRQVLTVTLGGFDTHDHQVERQAVLLAQLDDALCYFDDVMMGLGLENQVTTFTVSEFGRTFNSNGDGTDHGWGSHQFVLGGAVAGKKLYGDMPVLCSRTASAGRFQNSGDILSNSGAMIPTLAIDQYAATLGRWFGASSSVLQLAFPYLGNFAVKDLGFMRV